MSLTLAGMATLTRTEDGPRQLDPWRVRDPATKDLLATPLTGRERLRVYPLLWLVPLWIALIAALALLAGAEGWREELSFPAFLASMLGACSPVLVCALDVSRASISGRRAQAVLRRAARAGRASWTVADGEHVRVYALDIERRPGRSPKIDVTGAWEFHAERDAEAAHAHRAELDRAARPDPAAVALARVLNAP